MKSTIVLLTNIIRNLITAKSETRRRIYEMRDGDSVDESVSIDDSVCKSMCKR